MKHRNVVWLAAAACLLLAISGSAKKSAKKASQPAPQELATSYDASRDPAKDLQSAIAMATKANKKILLEVGGDWCLYCNMMDQTFVSHPDLQRVRDQNFVAFKVNYSKENPNETFLSRYPKIADYPHFFVLDSKGALLVSQPTHKFEHGRTYNAGKLEDFLKNSVPAPRHWLTNIG